MDYVHQTLNEDIQSISGTYTPTQELRLKHNGQEVLCVIGTAIVDTACCGSGNFIYATVPGFIIDWKYKHNDSGLSVSQVESLDDAAKREIAGFIKSTEGIQNINFW